MKTQRTVLTLTAIASAGVVFSGQPVHASPAQPATPVSGGHVATVGATASVGDQTAHALAYKWPKGWFNLRNAMGKPGGFCMAHKSVKSKRPYAKYRCKGSLGKKSHYLWRAIRRTDSSGKPFVALQNKKTKKCLTDSKSTFPTMKLCNRTKHSQHWWRVSYGEGNSRKKNFLVNRYHGFLWREAGGGVRTHASVHNPGYPYPYQWKPIAR